jgi:hypothetical protein
VEIGGEWVVITNKEPMSKTVAFRLPASTYSEMLALVEAFPDRSWGSAMRWLLGDDRVLEVIRGRVAASVGDRSA